MSKYVISGIGFRSIESIKEHVREIKRRATFGSEPEWGIRYMLSDVDMSFMYDMIKQLQYAHEIIGDGLATIQVGYVGKEIGKPHWGFFAIRIDASECLFGVGKFGKDKTRIDRDRVNRAKRNAIKDQTIAYKEEYFDGHEEAICEATGEKMTREQCHVDHASPTFLELSQAYFGDIPIEVVDDGYNWHIADESLRLGWIAYHMQHARLRCVTMKFNLSREKTHGSSPVLPAVQPTTPRNPDGCQMPGDKGMA